MYYKTLKRARKHMKKVSGVTYRFVTTDRTEFPTKNIKKATKLEKSVLIKP